MDKTTPYPQRKPLRLPGYDYASPGAYFITICTKDKRCLFGEIINSEMRANRLGVIVEEQLATTVAVRSGVALDLHVVMPNHMHAIIMVVDQPDGQPNVLGNIIKRYKAEVTKRIWQAGYPEFCWQRGYHDRVIRNERELQKVREYIVNNPARWQKDANYV